VSSRTPLRWIVLIPLLVLLLGLGSQPASATVDSWADLYTSVDGLLSSGTAETQILGAIADLLYYEQHGTLEELTDAQFNLGHFLRVHAEGSGITPAQTAQIVAWYNEASAYSRVPSTLAATQHLRCVQSGIHGACTGAPTKWCVVFTLPGGVPTQHCIDAGA
jgi:hypothetical protein